MIQHFVSIALLVFVSAWATISQQYPALKIPIAIPIETRVAVSEITPSATPPQLDTTIETLFPQQETQSPEAPKPLPEPTEPTPLPPLTIPAPPIPFEEPPTEPTEESPVVQDVDKDASLEALLKSAVVNIICIPGGGLRGSSGTGIIVDPRGIILTVAHVGQNFLVLDYPKTGAGKCYIRTGSPAKNAYLAKLIYISPQWVDDNSTILIESRPKGTGENDFAFLAITDSLTNKPLPRSFSYIPFAKPNTLVEVDDRVGVGSYAAEFLTSSEVRSSLYPTISFAPVDDIYTFEETTRDVISVHAGAAAQEGSSGGAVVNEDGELVGLISTRTVKPDLSLRDLQAISVDHIRRSFKDYVSVSLDAYMKNNSLETLVTAFSMTAKNLGETIISAINEAQ